MQPSPNQSCGRVKHVARFVTQNFAAISQAIIAIVVTLFFLNLLHESTYVWQSTVGNDLLAPKLRSICPMDLPPAAPLKLHWQPSIAIVVLYGGDWPPALMKRVLANKEFYAKYHGYTLINGNSYVDDSRPIAWSKLLAVEDSLYRFDYVMYIDMDAIIMDLAKPLDSFIIAGADKDFIMTKDWGGTNTGVWIAKNSTFAHNFLRTAWDQKQLVPKTARDGTRYPFEYEQRAFHYLLHSERWAQRGLPKYKGDYMENRRHIAYLPQCSFNSYSMHFMDIRGSRDTAQYVDGDFIIHFAGKKGAIKFNMVRYYLDQSEKLQEKMLSL